MNPDDTASVNDEQAHSTDAWLALAQEHYARARYAEALSVFERLCADDPHHAAACAGRAHTLYALGQLAEAVEAYSRALTLISDDASLYLHFGTLLKKLGLYVQAEALLREALRLAPHSTQAANNLGNLLSRLMRYDEALACFEYARALAPDDAEILNNMGLCWRVQCRTERALACYEAALRLAPNDPRFRWNYALALLLAGQMAAAWPYYEARWDVPDSAPRYPFPRDQVWNGQALLGTTLLLWHEQGLGDTLQMARFLPLLREQHPAARLVLRCPTTFHRLFASFALELLAPDAPVPSFDTHLPLMSLPRLFETTLATLPTHTPYLTPPPSVLAAWQTQLGPRTARPRIGIAWASGRWSVGQDDLDRQTRQLPQVELERLLAVETVEWINLQLGEPLPPQTALRDFSEQINDFADSAALVSLLDAVVCVDTAVAHLAGALNVPVYVLLRSESGHFFMTQNEYMPWYPSMQLCRQREPGRWCEPVDQAIQKLTALLNQF